MGVSRNKVRYRKRISFLNDIIPRKSALVLLFLVQFILLLFGANGGDVFSSSLSASNLIANSLTCNMGVFVVIYSALPQFAITKSIRNGKEVEDELSPNSTTIIYSIPLSTVNETSLPSSFPSPSSSPEAENSNSTLFSSRAIVVVDGHSEENTTTLTPSEEMEMNLDSSEELKKKRRKEGMNRLKRQMGMAAEIALIAPALQTMGCIPKFFCGMNSKPPTHESSALNDLAYLIKFAMLDDDDADLDVPIFGGSTPNTRGKDGLGGKDGLTRLKEDLILENMAEEELIQEDPAFLPFVWSDMEHRIKTKPGNKFRVEDVMDEIIIEPEQTAVGSLFTGIKSVLRIGRRRRSVDDVGNIGQGNESSQATARSGRNLGQLSDSQLLSKRTLRWQQRHKKKPFWTTPQFRQDMELAERIGKTEQDEGKCSTTFNVCPYTVHEMMDIVHGGYKKKRRKEMKRKKKPQWFVNANGPPPDSSEEETEEATKKPFKDKDNLVTTTTEKTVWHPSDPENQIYYAIYPHKAVEEGLTTVRTTTRRPLVSARPQASKRPVVSKRPHVKKRPSVKDDDDDDNDDTPEVVYDIGPRPMREHRKPPMNFQGHVEYENENDESSFEGKKPEHLDMMLNNKNNHQNQQNRQPPRKSWWSFGGGDKLLQRPPMHLSHQNGQLPGRRPSHQNMNRPNQHFSQNDHSSFDGGESREENNKSGNDEDDQGSSSEEHGKRKRKKNKGTSASDSVEDDDNNSSEEKNGREEMISSTSPPPPAPPPSPTQEDDETPMQLPIELQGGDPNIQIISIQPIQTTGGDMMPTGMPQKGEAPQPLQPFFHDVKSKQQPISLPRPKYSIQKERIRKKKRRFNNTPSPPGIYGASQSQQQNVQQEQHHSAPNTPEPTKKDDKSNEASEEDEEEDDKDSQENSSEEKSNKDEQSPAAPPPSQQPQPEGRPHINVILHGRPSEEMNEPPKQHTQAKPYPGDSGRQTPQTSASAEDDLDNSDEDNKNSNSAAAEPSSDEWSIEMAKIPQPARPPSPFRMNTSNEYTYSDENNGHPNGPLRPINYSYFKRHRDEQNRPQQQGQHNGPPQHQGQHNGPPQHHGQQGQHQSPPPPSTTQKYSTGFLSFMFGKDKKHQKHPRPGQRPHHQYQQQQQQQQDGSPPNYSEEDATEDDDDGDDSRSSEERDTSPPKLTSPEGKYEIGHLANKPPPKSIRPDFSPPQRPYRGSTSMEDSDEKRGRSTPAPPTSTRQTTVAPRPLVFSSYSNKFIIPPPATPPQRVPTSPATKPPTTEEPKKEKDSDEDENDDPESDEQKASDESKEDDDDNSSEESGKKETKKKTKSSSSKKPEKMKSPIPVPPVANADYHFRQPITSTTTQPTTTKSPTKNRADYGGDTDASDEKQNDSNETKEDDSAEEDVKVSREDSNEDASSEERENKKKTPPPPPRRKPEDDELEHASAQLPPQGPVVGDIAAVGQILGAQNNDDEDDYPEPYGGLVDNFPAAPPLQQVGFAPSLEIVVPTKAPLKKVPPGVPLTEFYQGSNPLLSAHASPGGAPGPVGAPPLPGQPLGSVNPTSLLGLAQQAGPNNRPPGANSPGQGEQVQQGLRQPGTGQTSNRGPSSGNRRPGQGQSSENNRRPGQGQNNQNNRRPQQGNNQNQQGNEDSEEDNSSEEKKESSEEEKDENDNGFDEAIENLGHRENGDDDNDRPQQDRDRPPPPPPPVFTGSKEQKHELHNKRPFFPRPITPKPPRYTRPNPGRREPILKHQLQPNQLLQIHHPQQIRPPPMKEAPLHQPLQHHHHQKYTPLVLPMRPSAAANLRPLKQQQRPSSLAQSFSVSHLLRPLMPMSRPMIKTPKPLDPKVVQWIKESYGIPDLDNMQGPNRSGLQSEDKEGKSTTTARPHSRKGEKPERKKKIKEKKSSRRKTTTVKPKNRGGSAEKRTSGEVINILNPIATTTQYTTTTTTTTKTPPTTTSTRTPSTTTTTKRTPPTTTTTKSPPTTTTTRKPMLPPKTTSTTTTTTTSSTTTAKLETKSLSTTSSSTPFNKRIIPDYITEEQEAKMAQALFNSSEEQIGEPEEEEKKSSEEEKDSSEEDDEEATTKKYKTKVKTKEGVQKLIITVKSVGNKNKTSSKSSSSERGKVSSGEKVSKLGKRPTKYSSMEKKKHFSSSRESSSGEQKRKHLKSNLSEVGNRKSSSSTEQSRRKPTKSSSTETKSKSSLKHASRPLSSSAEIKRIISTLGKGNTPRPKPKPIKLPPIYGKHSNRRTG